MISRTYGWVQNSSNFKNLKLVVQIFDSNSEHYINLRDNMIPSYIPLQDVKDNLLKKLNANFTEFLYTELVGTSKNKDGKPAKTRKEAIADALIQVTIPAQSSKTSGKMWTDNWTADCYLRWALSLNFVQHDRETDLCSITNLGKTFSSSKNDSEEEKKIIQKALLSYPPATQVLNILNTSSKKVTKFFIGNQLGFRGEKGFTSYDESLMEEWFCSGTIQEQEHIKSSVEGTSDKYARMICNWLEKVGYVSKHKNILSTTNGEKVGFQQYCITAKGKHAFNQSKGSSKNSKIEKFLTWEFLAVDGENRNYVRSRRAHILKILKSTVSLSFDNLIKKLRALGFNDEIEIIENDIEGLNNFGIHIKKISNGIKLKDSFNDFTIPDLNLTEELKYRASDELKAKFLKNTKLPIKYIELLDIAYDGKRNRDFEIITIDLFKNVYGLNAVHLGGGRKPDGIVYTKDFGIIIDTKAYSKGYGKSISQEDEMVRYIEDNEFRDINRNSTKWWENFKMNISKESFYFLWISSKFEGKFEKQLIDTYKRTGRFGGALNVEQLLIGAHKMIKGDIKVNEIPSYFKNCKIYFGDL